MNLKSCCLLCVTQARSRSLWFCGEQAPTTDPISEAALGMVLTLGDFQWMISHSWETPLLVNHTPRFSTSSALKQSTLGLGLSWMDGCWVERKETLQKANCVLWEERGHWAIYCSIVRHSLGLRIQGFYNSFGLSYEAVQTSVAYLRDGWGLRKRLLNKSLLHRHEDCLLP